MNVLNKPSYSFEGGSFSFVNVGNKDKVPFGKTAVIYSPKDRERFLNCFFTGGIHQYDEMMFEYTTKGPFLPINSIPGTHIGRIRLKMKNGDITILHFYVTAEMWRAADQLQGAFFDQPKVYPKGTVLPFPGPKPNMDKGMDAFLRANAKAQPPSKVYPLDSFPAPMRHGFWIYLFMACREGSFSLIPVLEGVKRTKTLEQIKK